MKYLRKFQSIADYQAFRGGCDWVTPNVSIITEDDTIAFEPFVNTNDSITFPVYLVEGDNGQLGIDVRSYIISKFYEVGFATYDNMTEDIYINGIIVSSADSPAPLDFVHNADIYLYAQGRLYYLTTTGYILNDVGGE